jgi:hypothetical protein
MFGGAHGDRRMRHVDEKFRVVAPDEEIFLQAVRRAREHGGTDAAEDNMQDPWSPLIGDVLTRGQVRTLLHLTADAEVKSLEDRGQIIALPDSREGAIYPSFQFTTAGEVKPEIPRIVNIFTRDPEPDTSYLIVSWLKSPKTYLNGQTPLQWLDLGKDADPVIVGAEQAAARLAS